MSAEVLRQAATLMRTRAELVTPGPWALDEDDTAVRARRGAGPTVVTTIPLGHGERRSNAAHVASWDPIVAVAVADWLDEEARYGNNGLRRDRALAVARAYLGESA